MSVSTHEELIQAVLRWSQRPDFRERAADAIPLAEAKINRRLRTREMETTLGTFTISGEYVSLPSNFAGVKAFQLVGPPKVALEFRPNDQMATEYDTGTNKPRFFNVHGSEFRFAPAPDTTYSARLVYYRTIPALTSSATTNWLLTSHPDAYLYGVLAELYDFAGDQQRADRCTERMYAVLDEVKTQSNRDRLGPGLTMRLA